MKNIFRIMKYGFFLLLASVFFSSCIPQKKIKYLQSQVEAENIPETRYFQNSNNFDYKVQPGDNLYIKIVADAETSEMLGNSSGNTSSNLTSDASIYLQSYAVDKDGYIDFPMIPKVKVSDMTVEEITHVMEKSIHEYVREATVFVKLVNFKITVLGEVHRPGNFKIFQDKVNIFEAIGMAGDLTDFADKNKVSLVRTTDKGYDIHLIDLTSDQILKSEYFYLMPNDVIYVEPLKAKQFGFAEFPYSILFSVISTTILVLNFIK